MAADHVSVKEAVLPFDRFDGADVILGPEMRSTGEVMGVARDFPTAFAKAQAAAGSPLPSGGTVFITVTDRDKPGAVAVAQTLHDLGFSIVATEGTKSALERMGIPAGLLQKVGEGSPNVVDCIESGEVSLVVNTPTGSGARADGWQIRRAAVARGVPCLTTLSGRAGGRPRDRLGAPGPGGGALAPGDPPAVTGGPRRRREAARAGERVGVQAPLGRRLVHVVERREHGAYVVLAAADPDGPVPLPGPVLHAHRERALGWGRRRAPAAAAGVLGPAHVRRLAAGARVHARGRRPGDARGSASCSAGDGLQVLGPLGLGFTAPRGRAPGRALRRRRRHRAARDPPGRAARRRRRRRRRCSGFRDAAHAAGAELLTGRAGRDRRRQRRALAGLVTDLLAAELDADADADVYACGPPPMLEAVRALCEARGVPAQLALESGMACGFGACFGCVVPVRGGRLRPALRRRPGARRRAARHVPGRAGTGAPHERARSASAGSSSRIRLVNGSGTFDAIAARRVFGRAIATGFPFAAFVSKTITLEPRDGNPPPRLYETAGGLINSIGLPNKGLRGYLEHDLPALAWLPVPLITNVMGSTAAEVVGARRGGARSAPRSRRSSSTSPARTCGPASTSAPTPPSSRGCSTRCAR